MPPPRVTTAPRRRTSPPSSRVLGGMLLSKDAIADVVEVAARPRLLPARARDRSTTRSSTSTGAASRPTPITVAAELNKRGELGRVGGAPYLHTLIAVGPDRGQRRLLRRDRRASGRSCAGWSRPAPGSSRWATARRRRRVDDIVDRRAGRDLRRSPSGAPARTTLPLGDIMQGTIDEIEAIGSRGGAMVGVPTGFADLDALTNGLHPGQMIVVAGRPGHRQGARARHAAADARPAGRRWARSGRRRAARRRRHGRPGSSPRPRSCTAGPASRSSSPTAPSSSPTPSTSG